MHVSNQDWLITALLNFYLSQISMSLNIICAFPYNDFDLEWYVESDKMIVLIIFAELIQKNIMFHIQCVGNKGFF